MSSAPPAFDLDEIPDFVERSDVPVSVADASADALLVYVNPAFERLTGYAAVDCIERNCRFLQGPSTDPAAVARIRAGIEAREFRLTMLSNYRADGAEFTNALLVGPVDEASGGASGEALARVGLQWDVGDVLERRRARLREAHWDVSGPSMRLEHFERLVLLTIDASRGCDPGGDPMALVERLVALAHPHQYPPHDRLPNWTDAGSLLPFLVRPYGLGLRDELRTEDRPGIVAVDVAYALSLAVHALALATWNRSTPSARIERGGALDVLCRPTSFRGEPVLELLWQVPTPRGAGSESAAVRARSELDVVARLFEWLGGTFEFGFDRARLSAMLRLPNRPLTVLDDA